MKEEIEKNKSLKKRLLKIFLAEIFIIILSLILMYRPVFQSSTSKRFFDNTDISVIPIEINKNNRQIITSDIELFKTVFFDDENKRKIEPGVSGCFKIEINTYLEKIKYKIKFLNIKNEKPYNLIFKIRGNNTEYRNLQDLEKELGGCIEKNTKNEIFIDWKWNYETGNELNSINLNNEIDTNDGKALKNYKFKILVTGEEI